MDKSQTYWTKEGYEVVFVGEHWRVCRKLYRAFLYDYLDSDEQIFEYNSMENDEL